MVQNDLLRRLRYVFDFNDAKMIAIFKLAGHDVTQNNVRNWLKKEEDPFFVKMTDKQLAAFLDGLIIEKRGKQEGPQPEPDKYLNNNLILRKLKIALNLKTDEILDLFALADKKISKHELSAFFRNPQHPSYRRCMDQYLRHFLNALQIKYKGKSGRRKTR